MTVQLHPAQTVVRWRVAEDGFWVGSRNGCFAGTIDQNGSHFYARDQFGSYLGDFPELSLAQNALAQRLTLTPAAEMARPAVA